MKARSLSCYLFSLLPSRFYYIVEYNFRFTYDFVLMVVSFAWTGIVEFFYGVIVSFSLSSFII